MIPNSWHIFGLVQGELAGLIVFLATISIVSWVLVGTTALLRFGTHLRYRRRKLPVLEEEVEQQ